MSFVTMNAIRVPDEHREEFERRFAQRASQVEGQDGFQAFELMRPQAGSDRYIVYTRWASKDAFEGWVRSPAFAAGHAALRERGSVATESEIWTFEVIESTYSG
jgi:heme-degrading monooxygenase HmoA